MKNEKTKLPLRVIYPNPGQPRKHFDAEKLQELADSIKEYGVLEPIVVTPRKDRYMIIAGERRFRASKLVGLKEIPVNIIKANDKLVEELALLENLQRTDLDIMEEARAFKNLLNRNWSQAKLAKKMGFKGTKRIHETVSLLSLDIEIQKLAMKGSITPSQAYQLSRLSGSNQPTVLNRILSGKLNNMKLKSFVNGLVNIENQKELLTLKPASKEEMKVINSFEVMMKRFVGFVENMDKRGDIEFLKKYGFKSNMAVDQIDHLIKRLRKIRRSIHQGSGIKEAMDNVA